MNIDKLIEKLKNVPVLKSSKSTGRRRYNVIACTLDKKGKVISIRTNDYNCTHPKQKYYAEKAGKSEAIYLHAEISALISSKREVHSILVARIGRDGKPRCAKPCPICQLAIKEYHVKNIICT